MITVENEQGTRDLAAALAPFVKKGDVITLTGDLGAGKTAFTRALVNALSADNEDVPSPTFTLVQTYELAGFSLWHFDLYRISFPEEVFELGWDEALGNAVSVIEWPGRLGSLLPADRLEIEISMIPDKETARRIFLTPCGASWEERLKGFEF